jgi:serine protease inhibitor ecotin
MMTVLKMNCSNVSLHDTDALMLMFQVRLDIVVYVPTLSKV